MQMTGLKWGALAVMAIMAVAVCSAQQKFPLRSGEWEATMSAAGPQAPPLVLRYCLNDALWEKALTQNPSCHIQMLNLSSRGASYTMDCNAQVYQMKGKVDMTFDGIEHMTAKGSIDMTMNGKTTHSVSAVDYRYKGATCSPNDLNLKQQNKAH